jgi:hypothetical protein
VIIREASIAGGRLALMDAGSRTVGAHGLDAGVRSWMSLSGAVSAVDTTARTPVRVAVSMAHSRGPRPSGRTADSGLRTRAWKARPGQPPNLDVGTRAQVMACFDRLLLTVGYRQAPMHRPTMTGMSVGPCQPVSAMRRAA